MPDHFVGLDNNAGASGATVVAGITIRDREAIEIILGATQSARDVAIAVRDAINLSVQLLLVVWMLVLILEMPNDV